MQSAHLAYKAQHLAEIVSRLSLTEVASNSAR